MNIEMHDETTALASLRLLGVRPKSLLHLQEVYGSLLEVWNTATFEGNDLSDTDREALSRRDLKTWKMVEQLVISHQVFFRSVRDRDYPFLLQETASAPPYLFLRGNAELLHAASPLAIVGARKISHYGEQVLRKIIPTLVHAGVCIVSGLAYGVDALAHEIALEHGGQCIAVFGSGVDVVYPADHRQLADRILLNGGLLISEQTIGQRPQAAFFPARNRIISGLSKATVVIEAQQRSGSLITAKFALEHNRDLFAVPGSIFNALQMGTNHLIAQGAYPVLGPESILEALHLESTPSSSGPVQGFRFENDDERQLYAQLKEPLSVDELLPHCALSPAAITQTLSLMELKGMIRQGSNRRYVRV